MSKKSKVKIWTQARKPRPPKFFLSAREQKERAFDVCDSLLLLRIQTLQKVH